ncbi:hypothetical protein RRF57_008928 [Xylaria bambusicola]|uniref:Uncharacterized protein n=1 Tax=Xylaria bambusicola TaxID=326684 RepID=A0AAN7V264_9PEZI
MREAYASTAYEHKAINAYAVHEYAAPTDISEVVEEAWPTRERVVVYPGKTRKNKNKRYIRNRLRGVNHAISAQNWVCLWSGTWCRFVDSGKGAPGHLWTHTGLLRTTHQPRNGHILAGSSPVRPSAEPAKRGQAQPYAH